MFKPHTLKILALILVIYGLLLFPAAVWPSYLDSPIGLLLLIPWLSIYLFHKIGIPGLLEHQGFCGWGWCSPTLFGWLFIAVVLLMVAWMLAWGIAVLTVRINADASKT